MILTILVNYSNILIIEYVKLILLNVNTEGTRRSTRKRKLKYENYSDTWIVGSQALKGYPNMVNEEENGKHLFLSKLKICMYL